MGGGGGMNKDCNDLYFSLHRFHPTASAVQKKDGVSICC